MSPLKFYSHFGKNRRIFDTVSCLFCLRATKSTGTRLICIKYIKRRFKIRPETSSEHKNVKISGADMNLVSEIANILR